MRKGIRQDESRKTGELKESKKDGYIKPAIMRKLKVIRLLYSLYDDYMSKNNM